MVHMVAAMAGMHEARQIYEAGYKSSNKLHLNPTSPFANGRGFDDISMDLGLEDEIDPAYENRFCSAWRQLGGLRHRFPIPADNFLRDGKAMLRMRPVASNCGELAIMAASAAWVHLGEPRPAPIALVSLEAPADHVFCVVGRRLQSRHLTNITIQHLTNSPLATDMWAVDPWLNVLCRLRDYPARAAAKFTRWQQANKRIAWADGPEGPGWYPPVGSYSAGFNTAGMRVVLG